MNKRTKTTALLAATYCLISTGFLGFAIFEIKAQGDEFIAYRTTISEHMAKETSYTNLARIIEETDTTRVQLAQFFITEKNTINFISEIETVAQNIGVKLETTSLSVVPKTDKTESRLVVDFAFEGNELAVKRFLSTLETMPYHSSIPTFKLKSAAVSSVWEGSATVHITIAP